MQSGFTNLNLKRRAVAPALILCAILAALGVAEMVVRPTAPRWLALCTIGLILACTALIRQHAKLSALPRQGFRVLRARHALRLSKESHSAPAIAIRLRTDTEFESLGPGQSTLTVQKFVAEPTAISGEATLDSWNYAARVADAKLTPRAAISPSRAVQIAFDLGRELREGEAVTLREDLDVAADPFEPSMSLAFQSPHPAELQDFELIFEGLRPLDAAYRIERGSGTLRSGPIPVEETSASVWRMAIKQRRARAGDQLVLTWRWDPAAMPSESEITERLLAEARERQRDVAAILAAEFGNGEAASRIDSLIVAKDDPNEGLTADDHPIIKAARAREAAMGAGAAPAKSPDDGS